MAASEPRKNDGKFALDDHGNPIIPTGKWRCDHYRFCGCVGYEGNPDSPGTCKSYSCTHAAYEHNE